MNRDNSLVTVVITTYSRPDYVNQAVESVLGQTLTDYQIIMPGAAASSVGVC